MAAGLSPLFSFILSAEPLAAVFLLVFFLSRLTKLFFQCAPPAPPRQTMLIASGLPASSQHLPVIAQYFFLSTSNTGTSGWPPSPPCCHWVLLASWRQATLELHTHVRRDGLCSKKKKPRVPLHFRGCLDDSATLSASLVRDGQAHPLSVLGTCVLRDEKTLDVSPSASPCGSWASPHAPVC